MSVLLESVFTLLKRQNAEIIGEALHNIFDLSEKAETGLVDLFLSLPGLCCKSLGGDPELAVGVASAWEVLYLAAQLLDTVADDGEFVTNLGLTVTLSVSFIPVGRMLLQEQTNQGLSVEICNDILEDFDRTLLRACLGQVRDLTEKEPSLDKCWEITSEKTGEIFALATRSGARLCSRNQKVIALFSDLGRHLGFLVQIGDDVNGLWSQGNTRSDLALGKWTLPISYAMQVLPLPEKKRLKAYLDMANSDTRFEVAARRMIVEAGALFYLAAETDRYRHYASKALTQAIPAKLDRRELMDVINRATAWIYSDANKVV